MFILIAILLFGVLVFVHELGHFLTAKAMDVQVNEFSICMGPAIFKKQKGETLYSLRCIPIGGYCAMEGEDEETDNPRAFSSKAWYQKLPILAAGSFMNFLLGVLILLVVYSCSAGVSTSRITGFFDDGSLQRAGLQVEDELYRIDGRRVYLYSDIGMLLDRNKTGVYDLTVKRDGKTVELQNFELTKKLLTENGVEQYRYGIYFAAEEMNFGRLLKTTWNTAMDFTRLVWMGLEDLISGFASVKDMSGPVGIVSVIAETGEQSATVSDGLLSVAYLGAFIAINLAVMNMLPIPALDGGRIFLLLVSSAFTAVTKKKIPAKYESYVHAVGMVLLLAFIAFVTFKDIWKLFS